MMMTSTQSFLTQLFDYAGMFPPAKLPLKEALDNYLGYRRNSPHAWMLGRFICPVAQLDDLVKMSLSPGDLSLLRVSALGRQSPDAASIASTLDTDMRAIGDFRRAVGRDSVVNAFELALPPDAVENPDAFRAVASRLSPARLVGFFEIPLRPTWQDDVSRVAGAIGSLAHDESGSLGLKLRCGGASAAAFPGDADVAHFVISCLAEKLPWKATAGLHHPGRTWDSSLKVCQHGFLNLFGASLLAWTLNLKKDDLLPILADRDASHFRFDAGGFSWHGPDQTFNCSEIAEARAWATSLGTCSFTEPCDDLRAMGVID
jgi:hypothetical protein